MDDTTFLAQAKALDSGGKESLDAFRAFLKENGGPYKNGITRLIYLAEAAITKPKRARPVQVTMDGLDGFEEFYAVFPKHVGPDAAQRAYLAAIRRGATPAALLAAARLYAAEMSGTEKQFIKAPASWLNAGDWKNELARTGRLSLVPANYVPPRTLADAVRRLEIFYLGSGPECPKGAWAATWAGKPPPEPTDPIPIGCLITPDEFAAFLAKHGRQEAEARRPCPYSQDHIVS